MSNIKTYHSYLIALLGLVPATALADESSADVQAELKALRAQVSHLEERLNDSALDEKRTEQVKALVKEVLSDADTRASFAEGGATAGYNGKNFFLASEDGKFLLKFAGQIDVRYTINSRDNQGRSAPAANDGLVSGFNVRRTKLSFDGYIGDPKVEYRILLDANRDTGGIDLQEASIAYSPLDNLRLIAGRFADRFAREQMITSKFTLAAERSAVETIYGAADGSTEGVGADWTATKDLKVYFTFNDGFASGTQGGVGPGFLNTGNDFANDSTDFAVTGRVDYKLAGDWAETLEPVAWSSSPFSAFIGAAAHYEVGSTGDRQASATTPTTGPYDDFVIYTLDTLVKYEGLTFMGAAYGWHFDNAAGNANGPSSDNYALTGQLGYAVIPDKFVPFVRWEYLAFDKSYTADNYVNILTVGATYFFNKHNLKLTADVLWTPDTITASGTVGTALSGVGLLNDAAGKKNQTAARVQLQLLF